MIGRLQELQISSLKDYRTARILRDKLLNACSGIDECRLALQKVAPTVEGVITDLHTSMATTTASAKYDKTDALVTALYTTRRRFEQYRKYERGDRQWKNRSKMKDKFSSLRKDKRFSTFITDALFDESESDKYDKEEASDSPDALPVQLNGLIALLKEYGNIFIFFNIHVVDGDIPILLSIADMNRHSLVYLNTNDCLMHVPSGSLAKVKLTFGHPMIVWNRYMKCLFIKNE